MISAEMINEATTSPPTPYLHYPPSQIMFEAGSVKSVGIQNHTCFVCNMEVSGGNARANEPIMFQNLCKILQLPEYDDYRQEINPFCTQCLKSVEDFFKLQKKIQQLINLLSVLRELVAGRLVNSYRFTSTERVNYHIKKRFHEAWHAKIEAVTGRSQLDVDANFQRAYDSIMNSLPGPGNLETETETFLSDKNSTCHSRQEREIDASSMLCSSPHSPASVTDSFVETEHADNNDEKSVTASAYSASVIVPPLSTIDPPDSENRKQRKLEPELNRSHLSSTSTDARFPGVRKIRKEGNLQKSIRGTSLSKCKQCDTCGKIFPSNSQLEMHRRIHTGEKPYECSICGKSFAVKFNMQKHELTHDKSRYDGDPQHECDICHKKFHIKFTLYTHRRDHFLEKPRPSGKRRKPPSGKAKPKPANVEDDSKTVDKKPKIRKNKSKVKLSSSNVKVDHKDTGYNDIKDKEIQENSTLTQETNVEPSDNDNIDAPGLDDDFHDSCSLPDERNPKSPLAEPRLKKRKPTKSKVSRHKSVPRVRSKKQREPKERRILSKKCSYCGKEFKSRDQWRVHVRIHTGEKPHECRICHRKFTELGNKLKHERNHDKTRLEGEPKLMCDICGKKYHLPGTLYHHRRRVHFGVAYPRAKSDVVPTPCPICGKVFGLKSRVPEHIRRVHQGVKRFNCEVCEKPFYSSIEAKGHVKFHSPTKLYKALFRYQCPECPPEYIGFPSKEAVRSHWAKEHKGKDMPEAFREIIKALVPGHYECMECPEDNRPVYKYRQGWLKHQKSYHRGKFKSFRLTRHNMAAVNRNKNGGESSNSDSTSSEEETDKEEQNFEVKTPNRRSSRRRVQTTNRKAPESNSENDSDSDGNLQIKTSKLPKNGAIAKKNPRHSFNRKDLRKTSTISQNLQHRMKELLGDKIPRIILTRIDKDTQMEQEYPLQPNSKKGSDNAENEDTGQSSIRIIKLFKVNADAEEIQEKAIMLSESGEHQLVPKEESLSASETEDC